MLGAFGLLLGGQGLAGGGLGLLGLAVGRATAGLGLLNLDLEVGAHGAQTLGQGQGLVVGGHAQLAVQIPLGNLVGEIYGEQNGPHKGPGEEETTDDHDKADDDCGNQT